ncbi:MAG TPA: orotate phosphoribosyltransferase [Candidatus Limnocylindria bacterium]|nr:orotate phosphoribosyltransferase [Candidatus Limnocylindria bacterium]
MVRGVPAPADLASASTEDLFLGAGALREGHFRLKSGLHSPRYLEKFLVFQYPTLASELCRRMAVEVARLAPNVVVGPTTGGVLLAFETARHLSAMLGWEVRDLFAEPTLLAGGRELRRGFEVSRADTIVLVDDILTTGTSLRETRDAVERAGGQPVAAVVIVDRSSEPVDIGLPILSVGRIEIPVWEPRDCPLCDAGDWLETPGSAGAT